MEQSIEFKGHTIKIVHCEDTESPRDFDCNIGKMLCFHNRYSLGDSNNEYSTDDFESFEEMKKKILSDKNVCVLPLYLYDHSGITISVEPFGCRFDSGQLGFIYAKKETIREMYCIKNVTKKILERVEADLRAEVKTYDDYIRGEVYGFQIYDKEGEELDSCYGFIGDPETSGCIEEAKSFIK